MKALNGIILTISIIGAINWGLIGFFDFNLVGFLFGMCGLYLLSFYGKVAADNR